MVEVRIEFPNMDKEKIKHLLKAEKELAKAGITFDTGYDLEEHRRDWEFDWSLSNAIVKIKKE